MTPFYPEPYSDDFNFHVTYMDTDGVNVIVGVTDLERANELANELKARGELSVLIEVWS